MKYESQRCFRAQLNVECECSENYYGYDVGQTWGCLSGIHRRFVYILFEAPNTVQVSNYLLVRFREREREH